MAALQVHGPSIRGKKGKKNVFPVKNTVMSPFLAERPQLSKEETSKILEKITSTFTTTAAVLAKLSTRKGQSVSPDVKQKRALLRSQLALGINEVTRALEAGKLRLALVCRSAQPVLITNHLMSLSATRDVPVLCLHGLSATLAPLLKLKVILAIGFKRLAAEDETTFDELVQSITALTPPVHAPWLQYRELPLHELKKPSTNAVLAAKTSKSSVKQFGKGKGQSSSKSPKLSEERAGLTKGNDVKISGNNEQLKTQSDAELKHSANRDFGSPKQSSACGDGSGIEADATSRKRKLSSDSLEVLSKKVAKSKTTAKPNYKSVSIIPVKIVPKKMKNKKELKRKRKQNKTK